MLADGIFHREGLAELLRAAHILAGITWIGLLYFFNLVQVPAYAAFGDEGRARNIAIDKVSRRALWWFRWAAVSTFVMGIFITIAEKGFYEKNSLGVSFAKTANGLIISLGMLLGIIMMLNVWGVIWRNQKVVLANAANVLAGGEPNPDSPAAARRAVMASRQNFVFSFGMLFCMVAASHDVYKGGTDVAVSSGHVGLFWGVSIVVIAILELNALGMMPWKTTANKGLNVIYDGKGTRNPLIGATVWLVIVIVLAEVLLKA
ncbi:MAG: antitermination protein NusG [Actinomycetota bacterium]